MKFQVSKVKQMTSQMEAMQLTVSEQPVICQSWNYLNFEVENFFSTNVAESFVIDSYRDSVALHKIINLVEIMLKF